MKIAEVALDVLALEEHGLVHLARYSLLVDPGMPLREALADQLRRTPLEHLPESLLTHAGELQGVLRLAPTGISVNEVNNHDKLELVTVLVTRGSPLARFDLHHHWFSLDDVVITHKAGLLKGDGRHWAITINDGFGGDETWVDLIAFLLEHGIDIGIDFGIGIAAEHLRHRATSRFRNGKRERQARRVAHHWATQQGIRTPMTLRWFLDRKDSWTESELMGRLGISRTAVRQLLKGLGYDKSANGEWRLGGKSKHLKRRARWIRDEGRVYEQWSNTSRDGACPSCGHQPQKWISRLAARHRRCQKCGFLRGTTP